MSTVTLISPKSVETFSEACGRKTAYMPFSLLYLGTVLESAGHKVNLLDAQIEDVEKKMRQVINSSDLIGLSVMTAHVKDALRLSDIAKEIDKDIPVMWGGVHPSLLPDQCVADRSIDYAVIGEGEETLVEFIGGNPLNSISGLVYKENGTIKKNPERSYIDLNKISPPNWDLLDVEKYVYTYELGGVDGGRTLPIHVGRGCPYLCTFCINTVIARKWRPLSAENVMKEINLLKEKYKLTHIKFNDDNFFIDKNRVRKVCTEMKSMGLTWDASCRVDYFNPHYLDESFLKLLQESGCVALGFGIETGSQKILDLICKQTTVDQSIHAIKKCAEHGIVPVCSFMSGLPSETEEDLNKTIDLIMLFFDICKDKISIHGPAPYRPYPGSKLYNYAKSMGLKEPESVREWASIDLFGGFFKGTNLPWVKNPEKLEKIEFYSMRAATSYKHPLVKVLKAMAKFRLKHRFYNLPIEMPITKWFVERM